MSSKLSVHIYRLNQSHFHYNNNIHSKHITNILEKHITNILKYAGNDLPQLTDRVQCLTNDVINLEGKKRNLMDKLTIHSPPELAEITLYLDLNTYTNKLSVSRSSSHIITVCREVSNSVN